MAQHTKDITHNIALTDGEFESMLNGHTVKIHLGNKGVLILKISENGE